MLEHERTRSFAALWVAARYQCITIVIRVRNVLDLTGTANQQEQQ